MVDLGFRFCIILHGWISAFWEGMGSFWRQRRFIGCGLAFEDASVEGHLRIFFGGLSTLLLVLTSACTQEFCDTMKWVDGL